MGKLLVRFGNWLIARGQASISMWSYLTHKWDAFVRLFIINKDECNCICGGCACNK